MASRVKIAAIQMDIEFGDWRKNLSRMRDKLEQLHDQQIFLAIFPECSLSGYCFESLEEASQHAYSKGDAPIDEMSKLAVDFEINLVFGFLERSGSLIFNAAALATRDGQIHIYRKIHLPYLGVDRFTTPGDRGLEIHEIEGVRMGINICYDCSFPESSRVLALKGADVVVLPTNWPPGAGSTADYIPNARALENNVYFVAANRVGVERGFQFIGKSKICHPNGHDLAFANHDHEETLIAEIDPVVARGKHLVRVPGKHELHRFDDRRVEMYADILKDTKGRQ